MVNAANIAMPNAPVAARSAVSRGVAVLLNEYLAPFEGEPSLQCSQRSGTGGSFVHQGPGQVSSSAIPELPRNPEGDGHCTRSLKVAGAESSHGAGEKPDDETGKAM